MDEKITQIIKEKFAALPESIQGVILSSDYENTLAEIGKKANLTVEQLGILEKETTMVMMGLTPTDNFERDLVKELHTDPVKGKNIVAEINQKIFLRIRDLLKLMNTPAGKEPIVDEQIIPPPENKDAQVLSSAGIEIVEHNSMVSTPTQITTPAANLLEGVPVPPKPDPIIVQKFGTTSSTPVIKTEYSLGNMSNNDKKPEVVIPKPPAKTYGPKADPYRLSPED